MNKKPTFKLVFTICSLASLALFFALNPRFMESTFLDNLKLFLVSALLASIPLIAVFELIRTFVEKRGVIRKIMDISFLCLCIYFSQVFISNLFSWYSYSENPYWINTVDFSQEEKDAARIYLKTALDKKMTSNLFYERLSPLLSLDKWGFVGDDPSLYQVEGIIGRVCPKRGFGSPFAQDDGSKKCF